MAELNAASIEALRTCIVANFNRGLIRQNGDWQKIARKIPSSSASNTYAWLNQWPQFRQWIGSRLHKTISETAYQVPNVPYESTIDVPRTTIIDDTFGEWAGVAEGHGVAVDQLMNTLIFLALPGGWATPCYDGQNFFDHHPVYPNADGTGTPTTYTNMINTGTNSPWYLLATQFCPPLVLQEREVPRIDSQVNPESDLVFNFDTFSFGAYWRGNAAYGFWQCAFGSNTALDPVNFMAAYEAMESQEGDGGYRLGTVPNIMVCGPSNRAAAEQLLLAERLANGASNTNYKRVDLIVSPWLP